MKRVYKIIATITAIFGFSVAAGLASAHPAYWDEYEYYSDPEMTNSVGVYGETCNGNKYQHGVVTPYYIQTTHLWCGNTKPPFDV